MTVLKVISDLQFQMDKGKYYSSGLYDFSLIICKILIIAPHHRSIFQIIDQCQRTEMENSNVISICVQSLPAAL